MKPIPNERPRLNLELTPELHHWLERKCIEFEVPKRAIVLMALDLLSERFSTGLFQYWLQQRPYPTAPVHADHSLRLRDLTNPTAIQHSIEEWTHV